MYIPIQKTLQKSCKVFCLFNGLSFVLLKIEAPNNAVNMILYLTLIKHIINKIGIKIDMLIYLLNIFHIMNLILHVFIIHEYEH